MPYNPRQRFRQVAIRRQFPAIATARTTSDPAAYAAALHTMFTSATHDVPYVPLVQPFVNVAMQKDISGFVNMFHRQLDYRPLTRS